MKKSSATTSLLFVFCVLINDIKGDVKNEDRIVGGYQISIENAPYQVYLKLQSGKSDPICGASIISKNCVLTAAHCIEGLKSIYIEAGTADIEMTGTQYSSDSLTPHPQYDEDTYDYDVGIIKIDKEIELNNKTITAVQLPDKDFVLDVGTILRTTGWGTTSEGSDNVNRYLLAVNVTTMPDDQCKSSYEDFYFTPREFCAGDADGGKDACQGDSGGPTVLIANGTYLQVGVISFGIGCGRKQYPGVYQNVAIVRDFIEEQCNI